MRVVFAIVVGLACPLTAAAQTAGDRYGPASATRLNRIAGEAFQGPALGWANKQAANPASHAVSLPPAPTPYRPQPVYAPFQPQVPLPLQQLAAAQPQPAVASYAPPTPVQAQPQARPQAVAPAPPQRLAAMVQPGMGGATRLYSVHRGYGMTPDAIPEPPAGNRYVLIGPPDAPPSAKTDDDAPDSRPGAF